MKIRSITAFNEVSYPLESGTLSAAGDALRAARQALESAGLTVQTTRIATQPFPLVLSDSGPAKAGDLAQDLEAISFVHEVDYVSIGPVQLGDPVPFIESITDVFRFTENVFAAVEIANSGLGVSLPRSRRMGELIHRVSVLSDDGFTNLRLAALANVPAWSPFFPAAYHGGGSPRIAVATESADLAVTAITSAHTFADARTSLVRAIEAEAERVAMLVSDAIAPFEIAFQGIDFSLAPFPEEERSIGLALERLGLPAVGAGGTLMAAAFLTDCIDQAEFTRTGFSGLMLPVLEDSVLAKRAAKGQLEIADLLTYTAVCGTGLDTIPLPGDISSETLVATLLDVAALALRLDKPLTARLMPLPGKAAGDDISFDFEYFADSRVMAPQVLAGDAGDTLTGLLAGDETLPIGSHISRTKA